MEDTSDDLFSTEEYYNYDNVDEYLRNRQQPYLDSLDEDIPDDVKNECAEAAVQQSACLSAQASCDVNQIIDAVSKRIDSKLNGIEAAVNELNAKFSKLMSNGVDMP